jgi:WD40 repeat protein
MVYTMDQKYGRILEHLRLVGHKASINSLHLNDHWLVSCSNDGKLFVWDLKSNSPEPNKIIRGHKSAVKDCKMSPS